MRIEKLALKNFRSHAETKLEFGNDRIIVFRGNHGTGKSSVALAIEFLLTGACGVTDAAGRGAEALVMRGADEMQVKGGIAMGKNLSLISRSRTAKTGGNLTISSAGKVLVSKQADAWIDEKIGPKPVLSAVLNASRFLRMNDDGRKQLLSMALVADPVELPEQVREDLKLCEAAADLAEPGRIEDIKHAKAIFDRVYAWRRDVNRDIATLGELKEPAPPEGMPDAAEAQQKLNRLHGERQLMETSKTNALAEYRDKANRLRQAEADLKEYEPQTLSVAEMERLNKLAGKKETVAKLDQDIAITRADISRLKREVDKLKADPGSCPTCRRAYEKRDLTEDIHRAEHAVEIAEMKLGELVEKRALIQGDPAEAEQKLAAHRKAVPKLHAAETAIREIGKLSAAPDVSPLDDEIKALDERITKGTAAIARINQFLGEKKAYARQRERLEALEATQVRAQRLVDYFGPDGELRPKLMGDKLNEFKLAINVVLKRFGFFCEFTIEPFSLTVSYLEGGWKPLDLKQLSESEEFRFGVAFQIALAEATKVNLVVVDRADLLLPGAQRFLNAALMGSNLDQAFILAAKEDLSDTKKPPTGVRFVDLAKERDITKISAVHKSETKELVNEPL
jgi:DNA repair exonuclease SbcCD ATPase subunit